MTPPTRCTHTSAVPVESTVTGDVLAALCPDCGVQLPAEFLTCPHENVIDTPALNQRSGLGICNDCGVSACYDRRSGDSAMVATLVASGWDPASAHRAVESKDFTLLTHTAFERPQAVISFDQDVSAEDLAKFKTRFGEAQQEYRVMLLPDVKP